MAKYYYKRKLGIKKIGKYAGLGFLFAGIISLGYVFFPLFSWQIFFAPSFSRQKIAAPIPRNTIVNGSTIVGLISQASDNFSGIDYTNADNWFPSFEYKNANQKTKEYFLTIPKLGIKGATVSTQDNDLSKHLVNFGGTAIPPEKGNAVIFGHSTLPQLFNPKDYKTIFATLFKLEPGDEIFIQIENTTYKFRVFSIIIVNPSDTSVFEQNTTDSFLTLVTCTPPGTTWKRLIIKAKLEKI
ncbi:sortase [Patescibacteria group bacterium]|nr:sortase [Patescibacteria group bacterium]